MLKHAAGITDLSINTDKTKLVRKNNEPSDKPIYLSGTPIEEADEFSYLGSVVRSHGGAKEDIATINKKAQAT